MQERRGSPAESAGAVLALALILLCVDCVERKRGNSQRKSLCARCGIRPADIWTAINGHSLASPEQVLNVYQSLRQSDQLAIALLRDGAPLELHVAFRDAGE